jgi:hypothetical protein
MSWDVLIFVAPFDVRVDEITDDYAPPPLGSLATVHWRLRAGVTGIDLSDPAWGVLHGHGWTIELNIGLDEAVHSIMLHVRGTGDEAVPAVREIAVAVGGRAMDVAEGEFLTGDDGDLRGWHGYQDEDADQDRAAAPVDADEYRTAPKLQFTGNVAAPAEAEWRQAAPDETRYRAVPDEAPPEYQVGWDEPSAEVSWAWRAAR